MSDDDTIYYQQRAHAELKLALSATVREAAKAHYLLAEAYLKRVKAGDRTGTAGYA